MTQYHKDFCGQTVYPGNWMAKSGAGNSSAEYGAILYYVLETHPKLKLRRLTSRYHFPYNNANVTIGSRTTTITKSSKYVRVEPDPTISNLFMRAVANNLTAQERTAISKWLHGSGTLT